MKNIFRKIKNQRGYALLFTMVVVTSISLITAGLSNTISKQLKLSLLAKHSQIAFSQADTGTECGLYIDRVWIPDNLDVFIDPLGFSFSCGDVTLIMGTSSNENDYTLSLDNGESLDIPCFKIEVVKNTLTGATTLKSRGYNICNTNNSNSVERAIEINY